MGLVGHNPEIKFFYGEEVVWCCGNTYFNFKSLIQHLKKPRRRLNDAD